MTLNRAASRTRTGSMLESLELFSGSDYHGTFKEGVALGRGRGDLEVPEQALADLKAARA